MTKREIKAELEALAEVYRQKAMSGGVTPEAEQMALQAAADIQALADRI